MQTHKLPASVYVIISRNSLVIYNSIGSCTQANYEYFDDPTA